MSNKELNPRIYMAQVASDFFITDFWSHQTGYEEVYIFSR